MSDQPTRTDSNRGEVVSGFYGKPDIVEAFKVGNFMWVKPFIDKVLQSLGIPLKDVKVADLGCGTGVGGKHFLSKGVSSYTGIDITPQMTAEAVKRLGGEATIITGSYVMSENPEIADLSRKFNLVLAIASSDFQTDFFKHVGHIIEFAEDGATVFVVEYYEGNFNSEMANKREVHPSITVLHNQQPFIDLGLSLGTTVAGSFFSIIRDPFASASFISLTKHPAFIEYTKRANAVPLSTITAFVAVTGAQVGIMKGGAFNPAVIVFKVTPELRETVKKHNETGGEA